MKRGLSILIIIFSLRMLVCVPAANAEWVEGGIPVCSESGSQVTPRIVPDGVNGAIITWGDVRGGDLDIYARRIGPYGRLEWSAGGIPVCTEIDQQYSHCTISDGAGGAIIAWVDRRYGSYTSIYAQRINGAGDVLWVRNGVAVCPVAYSQDRPGMVTDGANGAIIVWEDLRGGRRKAYAQRIDLHGDRLWGWEGIEVSDSTLRGNFLQVVSDDTDGAIIVWVTPRSDGWTLYSQNFDSDGSRRWSEDVVVASGTRGINGLSSITDASGGAIVAWYEFREEYPWDRLYAQRVDASGAARWTSGGVLVYASGTGFREPEITKDGNGGAVVVWGVVQGNTYWQYAQRMDNSGEKVWQEDGVEICYMASVQRDQRLISNGTGGAIPVWSELRDPAHYDLIAQRVDGSGGIHWTVTGLSVCSANGNQFLPAVIPDNAGGAIIAWDDGRNGRDIYALRIDADGGLPQGTRLQSYSAHGAGYDIHVEWILEQAGNNFDFSIFRAVAPDTAFRAITDPEIVNRGLTYTFIDRNREPATTYRYRVDITDGEGTKPFLVTDPVTTSPMPVTLYQNYPNPFNPQTTIYYYLPGPGRVTLEIYDVSGRWIFTVLDDWREMGHHGESWDGYGVNGEPLPSGVYFCRLKASMGSSGRKMILVR